jgi:hypothetical protein
MLQDVVPLLRNCTMIRGEDANIGDDRCTRSGSCITESLYSPIRYWMMERGFQNAPERHLSVRLGQLLTAHDSEQKQRPGGPESSDDGE